MNEILEWRDDEKKKDGMYCLKILFLNVYWMEMKRESGRTVSTRRRMLEVWKDEGKEEEEGRREWERRWREVGDIMNEEDVMETSIMHLCIPDYEGKEKCGLILPSECSYNALSVLLNEKSDRECPYHFPGDAKLLAKRINNREFAGSGYTLFSRLIKTHPLLVIFVLILLEAAKELLFK